MTEDEKTSLELLKHYGNMRFVMLPMFFTTMGAILFAFWTVVSSKEDHRSLIIWCSLAGIAVSYLFIVYEFHLSKSISEATKGLPTNMSGLKKSTFGWVTIATASLYAGALIFWLGRLCWAA